MLRLPVLLLLALMPMAARAADCPDRPDALGTARVLAVDPARQPPVGRKSFPQTLPLGPKEVVLTFDDGPLPGTTETVLAALAHECVRATFFLVGRNAAAHPALARRIAAEGHTVGHHTFSHPRLDLMMPAAALADIDRGFAADDLAVYGSSSGAPRIPFFRFPGFASTPGLLAGLRRRGIVVFGADLWASDWNPMTPEQELHLVMERLAASGGGILLLHDIRRQTAVMVPALLRALKRGGYRVVHLQPADPPRAEGSNPRSDRTDKVPPT